MTSSVVVTLTRCRWRLSCQSVLLPLLALLWEIPTGPIATVAPWFNWAWILVAIATGGGIGILPTYARAISRRVRPLDLPVRLRREILCVVNPARTSSPGVQLALTWLGSCFAGDIYPWFRDEFVHPKDFEREISMRSVMGLFEGVIDGMDTEDDA